MNFNDSFYYSLKYYFRNKKELITTFLVAIVLSLIIFAFSFHKSLNKYWDDSMTKLVDYSKLVTGHAHVLSVRKFFQN